MRAVLGMHNSRREGRGRGGVPNHGKPTKRELKVIQRWGRNEAKGGEGRRMRRGGGGTTNKASLEHEQEEQRARSVLPPRGLKLWRHLAQQSIDLLLDAPSLTPLPLVPSYLLLGSSLSSRVSSRWSTPDADATGTASVPRGRTTGATLVESALRLILGREGGSSPRLGRGGSSTRTRCGGAPSVLAVVG